MENLTIDGSNVLDARDTRTDVSDGGTTVEHVEDVEFGSNHLVSAESQTRLSQMTDSQNPERDYERPFQRRDLMKLAGGTAFIGAFGTQKAEAKQHKRFVVGVEPGRAEEARGRASEVKKTLNFGDIGQAVVGRWSKKAVQKLQNNPNVRYIEEEEHKTVHLESHDTEELDWSRDRLDVDKAHDAGKMGGGINVAIIDSGIDSRHPYLEDNLHDSLHTAPAECDQSDCPEDWHDTDGHGTGVAGIVAASHDDFRSDDDTHGSYTLDDKWNRATIGVAPEATLHAVKVFDGDGSYPSTLAEGINWCADNSDDIDVANMSLGGGNTSAVGDAMENARDNGVILVSSAGNEEGGDVTFPGGFDQDIAVSGITELDELSGVSSTGPEVDIGGPTRRWTGQDGRGDRTTKLGTGTNAGDPVTMRFSGTSAAAPHVAGVAALLLGDGTSPANVQTQLEGTAEDLGLDSDEQGAGLVDAANALGLESANDLLEVATDPADDLQYTTARLNGQLTHLVGNDTATVFLEYREEGTTIWESTAEEDISELISPVLANPESFNATITGLKQDTTYEFRAVARVEDPTEPWTSTERGEDLTVDTVDNPDPIASFTHDPEVPDPEETVTFDASGSDPGEVSGVDEDDSIVSYEWDFEDDGTFDATGETTDHSYSTPDDVTVRLRVTDEFGQTDETTETFRVNAPPEAAFDWTPTLPNEGDDIEFDAGDSVDPDGDIVSYEWDFGDGNTGTGEVVTHNYGPAGDGNWGDFDVTLTVTDNDDATDEVTEEVRVNAYPVAEPFDILVGGDPMDPTTNPVVRDEPVAFDASDSFDPDPDPHGGIAEYAWDFGDGDTGTGETVTHTYTEGGEFDVTLTLTDIDGASHEEISVHEETFTVSIRVMVEIKPNDDNDINPRRRGVVPVAVHHTADFDSSMELDPSTVQFGAPDTVNDDDGAVPSHNGGHIEDVDDDGDDDWLGHFPVQDTGFERGDEKGKLVGETTDSPPIPVFGFDEIQTVGRN